MRDESPVERDVRMLRERILMVAAESQLDKRFLCEPSKLPSQIRITDRSSKRYVIVPLYAFGVVRDVLQGLFAPLPVPIEMPVALISKNKGGRRGGRLRKAN